MTLLSLALALQSVTVDEVASVEQWTKKLEEPGITHAVDPQFADMQVWIHAEEQPKSELRNRLAKAIHCHWKRIDDTRFFLTRSDEAQASALAERAKRRKPSVEKWIKENSTSFNANPDQDAETIEAKLTAYFENGQKGLLPAAPADVLRNQLAISLGPATLSEVPYGGITIYSNRPTSAERPLPAGAEDLIRKFESVERAVKTRVGSKSHRWPAYQRLRFEGGLDPADRIVLQVTGGPDSVSLNLTNYSAGGKILSWSSTSIPFEKEVALVGDLKGELPAIPKLDDVGQSAIVKRWIHGEEPLESKALCSIPWKRLGSISIGRLLSAMPLRSKRAGWLAFASIASWWLNPCWRIRSALWTSTSPCVPPS